MLTVACHGALRQKTMTKITNGENALYRSCKKLVALISEQVSWFLWSMLYDDTWLEQSVDIMLHQTLITFLHICINPFWVRLQSTYSWWANPLTILDNLRENSTLGECLWKGDRQMHHLFYFGVFQSVHLITNIYVRSYNLLNWLKRKPKPLFYYHHHIHSWSFRFLPESFLNTAMQDTDKGIVSNDGESLDLLNCKRE